MSVNGFISDVMV